jgi:hypothetical protein
MTNGKSQSRRNGDLFDNYVVGKESNMIMGLLRMGAFVTAFCIIGGLVFYFIR